MKELYLSNVITDEDLEKIRPGEFNVLQAPRGWGKTTFMFDDRILKFSRAKKHVLYLIHNKLTRDAIVEQHSSVAVAFSDVGDSDWFSNRQKGVWHGEENEDKIHIMCYQTFAALLRNEGVEWLNDIDLIVWDEFDDIKTYYEKEVKQLKKMLPSFSRERLIALLQEGKPNSIINFVYQIKLHILDAKKIRLLAISATPENASVYFRDYINYILEGRLQEKFAAEQTIFIDSVAEAIKTKIIAPGRNFWCFTAFITDGFRIANLARGYGFNPLVLWSRSNRDWAHLMTQERLAALDMLEEQGRVPDEYDFVIITAAGSRSLNIYDIKFQDWICNSNEYEDVGQFIRARFSPARQYLLVTGRGIVDFVQDGFAADYYEWHNLDELRELLKEKPIYNKDIANRKKLPSFNAVRREYPEIFESRKYGKTRTMQYRIKPAV